MTAISDNSARIAKNTVFLYIRMMVMLLIGLFTSRVILQTLGKADYGTYGVVAGVVTMFTLFTDSIANAISRFITAELGRGDKQRLKEVFSAGLLLQVVVCIVLALLVETIGYWFLNNKMDIPIDRLPAANWVLQCALLQLVFVLFSAPYNAVMIAHEHMKAYAYISILEALLKLSVAILLMLSSFDKLKTYAVLMAFASLLVRMAYQWYCRRHFEESRSGIRYHKDIVAQILKYAGWSALPAGVAVINTQGLNILSNLFFGVIINAGRQVALQVDSIVRQFVINVCKAVNPPIIKYYSAGDKQYAYSLSAKSGKYSALIVLLFAVPFLYEGRTILWLWLGDEVPENATAFAVLSLFTILSDYVVTFNTVISAEGRIRNYSIVTAALSILAFPATWLVFRLGANASMSYIICLIISVSQIFLKLWFAHRLTGYPYEVFFRDVLAKIAVPFVATMSAGFLVTVAFTQSTWWRLLISLSVCTLTLGVTSYLFALTDGERQFILRKIKNATCKFFG